MNFRLIFEQQPLTISGLCIATNVAGTLRKHFTIKLLSLEKTRKLLQENYKPVERNYTGSDNYNNILTELDLEEIKHLRHQYDIKENKRIREQLKVV